MQVTTSTPASTQATAIWTTVRVALSKRPDGATSSLFRIEFRGALTPEDALLRTCKHITNDRSLSRDYLLNCVSLGNYEVIAPATASTLTTANQL